MSQFIDNLSGHFGLNQADIDSVIRSLTSKESVAEKADISSELDSDGVLNVVSDDVLDNVLDKASNVTLSEKDDKLDYIELFLAVSLGAKMRDAAQDPRYKKLKLLLNNNSRKAVNLANLWMDGKLSFDKMLATI